MGKLLLILASAVFYLYGGTDVALIFTISIVLNYLCAVLLYRQKTGRKYTLAIAVCGNVLLLFHFKYVNFLIENLNLALQTEFTFRNVVLPLGISFFTFQQIMYLVKVCDGTVDRVSLTDYLVYILYFPKLLSGPITEPQDLLAQFHDPEKKKVNWENLCDGLKIFSLGLFKKMLLADTFALAVNWGYTNYSEATSLDWFFIMIFYTFEIYYDFSGYSDMATGVSLMLNIELPINFDSPYKAVSIRDFWKRWHMTLTGFLTRYVYIPLGGSRKGRVRTYVNTMLVFLVSGIWHGANWTFILWGLLHGAFSVFDRVTDRLQQKLFVAVRWCCTFLVVSVLWLLFRSDTVAQWTDILTRMFSLDSMTLSDGLLQAFELPETPFLLRMLHLQTVCQHIRGFSMWCFTLGALLLCLIPKNTYRSLHKNNWFYMGLCAAALVWGCLCLSSESVFVYFNF